MLGFCWLEDDSFILVTLKPNLVPVPFPFYFDGSVWRIINKMESVHIRWNVWGNRYVLKANFDIFNSSQMFHKKMSPAPSMA